MEDVGKYRVPQSKAREFIIGIIAARAQDPYTFLVETLFGIWIYMEPLLGIPNALPCA